MKHKASLHNVRCNPFHGLHSRCNNNSLRMTHLSVDPRQKLRENDLIPLKMEKQRNAMETVKNVRNLLRRDGLVDLGLEAAEKSNEPILIKSEANVEKVFHK